jgi:carboxylesterase type B
MSDVVLVTFNYRVGPHGFLYLNDKSLEAPGNAGLKDQLMVMKFVKENIKNFGGDSDNITLFGHSAGGASVSWHCVSERSKGLFHRAIIMSGCVMNQWAFTPHRDWALRLAKACGYEGNQEDERDVLEFLQNTDPSKMVQVQRSILRPEEFGKIAFAFAPHVEPYTSNETFISRHPIDLVRSAWTNDIDILIGGTSDEGLMYLETLRDMPNLLPSLKLENLLPAEVGDLSSDDPIRLRFAEKLLQTYYSSSAGISDPKKDELAFCKVIIQQRKSFCHAIQIEGIFFVFFSFRKAWTMFA